MKPPSVPSTPDVGAVVAVGRLDAWVAAALDALAALAAEAAASTGPHLAALVAEHLAVLALLDEADEKRAPQAPSRSGRRP